MKFALNPAPYMRSKRTTRNIMLELSIALVAVWIASIIYNFTVSSDNGLMAIVLGVVSVLVSVVCEAIWFLPAVLKTNKGFKKVIVALYDKVLHSYGYVTGLILALLLPVGTPIYALIVTAIFSTVVVKLLFGGFGHNIFNPAIAGRIFAQLCFGAQLTTSAGAAVSGGATITTEIGSAGWINGFAESQLNLGDILLGNYSGTLGETFTILLLVIAVVLIIRRVINWRIVVSYVGTIFLATLLMGLVAGYGLNSFEYALIQISIGGVMFGAVFCLVDPVTSPTSPAGKIIYAVGAALVTLLIRYQASAAEGVAYSILIMNMLTPLIDKVVKGKTTERIGLNTTYISSLVLVSLIFGGAYGLKVKDAQTQANIPTNVFVTTVTVDATNSEKYRVSTSPTTVEGNKYYSVMELDVTVSKANQTVNLVELISTNATAGYGLELFSDTSSWDHIIADYGNPERLEEFKNNFVNFSAPVAFATFEALDVVYDDLSDFPSYYKGGVTYTIAGYLHSINQVIDAVRGGM